MPKTNLIQPGQSYTFADYFNLNFLQRAVSTGNIWQFGQFNRQSCEVTQDLDLYRVPADLDELLGILIRILGPND